MAGTCQRTGSPWRFRSAAQRQDVAEQRAEGRARSASKRRPSPC